MKNIKVYKPPGEASQVETFIEALEPKLREKLVWQIFRLSRTPPAGLKEPHYKHFSDADPQSLIEEPFEQEGYLYTFADIVTRLTRHGTG